MEHKKYMDIERLNPSFVDGFEKGDYIVIQEKIDGANASWQYDKETDLIQAFSRKHPLDFKNNLRGFFEFTQGLNKDNYKHFSNLRAFSEWLVAHTVVYPKDRYNNAYVYDLYDTVNQVYLTQDKVKHFCQLNNLIYVPVFYEGEFISWEHVASFVGRTDLGGEYGEGVVVKNMTKLNNPNTRLPFYTKIVCEKFSEKKEHVKTIDVEGLEQRQSQQDLTATIVTEARVVKLLHKLVDDGIIPEDWNEKNMPDIAKNLPRNVYDDCVKEEKDTVEQVGSNFGKFASSLAMKVVRDQLADR